jgi:hypothetical protein
MSVSPDHLQSRAVKEFSSARIAASMPEFGVDNPLPADSQLGKEARRTRLRALAGRGK